MRPILMAQRKRKRKFSSFSFSGNSNSSSLWYTKTKSLKSSSQTSLFFFNYGAMRAHQPFSPKFGGNVITHRESNKLLAITSTLLLSPPTTPQPLQWHLLLWMGAPKPKRSCRQVYPMSRMSVCFYKAGWLREHRKPSWQTNISVMDQTTFPYQCKLSRVMVCLKVFMRQVYQLWQEPSLQLKVVRCVCWNQSSIACRTSTLLRVGRMEQESLFNSLRRRRWLLPYMTKQWKNTLTTSSLIAQLSAQSSKVQPRPKYRSVHSKSRDMGAALRWHTSFCPSFHRLKMSDSSSASDSSTNLACGRRNLLRNFFWNDGHSVLGLLT